jgi:ubiquitin carboxyl-terminal hydrolase 8
VISTQGRRVSRRGSSRSRQPDSRASLLCVYTSCSIPCRSTADSDVNQSSGGSIADRMRALQGHGLAISSTKRLPREPPSLPAPLARPPASLLASTPPSPPTSSRTPLPLGPPPLQPVAPTSSLGPPPSHTFVPPSALGPPSPPSSPPTSPPSKAVTNFNHNFPSIHELEESLEFNLPSVPTGISTKSSKPTSKDVQTGDISSPSSSHFGNIALHIERPSSTPNTPTTNVFNSRPASPSRANAPHKPSGLSTATTPATDDITPTAPKIPIPHTNTAFPKDLQKYMQDYTVLLIDVRNRADFDKEHIRAQSVVCIEPNVLLRGK